MMKLKYGYSFYPEQCLSWEEIERDIKLIKESGANVVRMGEFCWDKCETSEGIFDFDWLEKVVNKLGENGISTVMCTPTAAPPIWIMKSYPDMRYVDNRNIKKPFGARHHFCYNNEEYRRLSKRIAEKIGEVFGENPYIVGFQIGNEFGMETSARCHCKYCNEKFRKYLKNRYKNISNLNKSWGTAFWAQTYSDFEQIDPPIAPDELHYSKTLFDFFLDNPSLRLVHQRFCSDSLTEYLNIQFEALRSTTNKPITTNSTGLGANFIDYFDFYKKMDLYGVDAYPPLYGNTSDNLAFDYSFGRKLKEGNFWVLEFSIGGGHATWERRGRPQPIPGAIELFTVFSFVSGAELLTHFQFKVFRSGAEQLNYALLDQDAVPRRRYFEFRNTAKALAEYESMLLNTKVLKSKIAIMIDYDSLWALRIKPIGCGFDYIGYAKELTATLAKIGYSADIIGKNDSLNEYNVVIIPAMILMSEETKERITEFARSGKTVVCTFLTAVKDINNYVIDKSLPCGLNELFGMTVSEYEPVLAETQNSACTHLKNESIICENKYWMDIIECETAESISELTEGYRSGQCVASKNNFGSGRAYYIGTGLAEETTKKLLDEICRESDCYKIPFELPANVEAVVRCYDDATQVICLFNFDSEPKCIKVGEGYQYIDGKKTQDVLILNSKEYCFITKQIKDR